MLGMAVGEGLAAVQTLGNSPQRFLLPLLLKTMQAAAINS